MSARTRWSALSIAIPLLLASSAVVHAGPWSLAPGEFYTEIRSGWFSSDTYHDQDGGRRFLAGGGLWEQRRLLSYTEFGWKPSLSFVLGIPVESVSRRFGDTWPRAVPSQTGLGDGQFGFRYRWISRERVAASLQLDWKAPLGYERDGFLSHADSVAAGDADGDGDSLDVNAARQLGSPVLGNGEQALTLSLLLGATLSRGFVQIGGGYRYRPEGRKVVVRLATGETETIGGVDQIVLSADLGLWATRSVLLAGRYEGELSTKDEREDFVETSSSLGFIRTVPAFAPSQHRVGPWLVYRLDEHMDLFAGSLHTASAKNALHLDEIHVGFAFRKTKLNRLQGFLGGTATP